MYYDGRDRDDDRYFWTVMSIVFILFGIVPFGCTAKAHADPIKIAIIDTGYNAASATYDLKLCKSGHYDFALDKPVIGTPGMLHGTHIGSIIGLNLAGTDYCAVIYNVETNGISIANIMRAMEMAIHEHVRAINISIVGPAHSFLEKKVIEKITQNGIAIFAAAGNENQNLDQTCNSYPGCYNVKGLYFVGALSPDGTQKAIYSNYGSMIRLWYPGHFQSKYGVVQGTSYAAPYALSDYVRTLPK